MYILRFEILNEQFPQCAAGTAVTDVGRSKPREDFPSEDLWTQFIFLYLIILDE